MFLPKWNKRPNKTADLELVHICIRLRGYILSIGLDSQSMIDILHLTFLVNTLTIALWYR